MVVVVVVVAVVEVMIVEVIIPIVEIRILIVEVIVEVIDDVLGKYFLVIRYLLFMHLFSFILVHDPEHVVDRNQKNFIKPMIFS